MKQPLGVCDTCLGSGHVYAQDGSGDITVASQCERCGGTGSERTSERPCFSLTHRDDGQMEVVWGHASELTRAILDARMAAMRKNVPLALHYCEKCGAVNAITIGRLF